MRLLIAFLVFGYVQGQSFEDLRTRYGHFEENDERAFVYVNVSIQKAKAERNFIELTQAYKDAVSFSRREKIRYADSSIIAASQAKNHDLLASAYLTKGTVYYFHYRKFKPALDEYLKAWAYSKTSPDQYLYHKNLYHIGVVRSHLGEYEAAAPIFEKCNRFFSGQIADPNLPNIHYNNQKGYLNSLHQYSICLIALQRYAEAKETIGTGLRLSSMSSDYLVEKSYFLKQLGILNFLQKKYNNAITDFHNALPSILKKEDFAQEAVLNYYLGMSYWMLGNKHLAVKSFQKNDSIFRSHTFILPQVRKGYEMLIDYYRDHNNVDQQLYYTTQLLKADRILVSDFQLLSTRISKEYDTYELIASKEKMERKIARDQVLLATVTVSFLGAAILVFGSKKITFLSRMMRLAHSMKGAEETHENLHKPTRLASDKTEKLLIRLERLENECFFLKKGLTLNQLAIKLKTNTTYLSGVINERKGCNFNSYINGLRIRHVTKMLTENRAWRKYSLDTLVAESGFSNRSKFTQLFVDHNGMNPMDFVERHPLQDTDCAS
ncbi:helix-turn-helix domain-containing protein [Chryseobacterium sp. R2A-55]|uniref:helix-turn-helix domain-containing protein n=1 Tax=Chryseobacterium sp. R2A-55 TaxID=2744445 RepID=UPI001F1BC459|nr:helix-turn-helix domain-containing protein [Chryseobacterium sp. R2A-55]